MNKKRVHRLYRLEAPLPRQVRSITELEKLRILEEENGRLKRVVADLTLDKHILQEALRK